MRKVGKTLRFFIATLTGSYLEAPTSLVLVITKPDATTVTVSLAGMTMLEAGKYFYDYLLPLAGYYTYTVTSDTDTIAGSFNVENEFPTLTVTVTTSLSVAIPGALVSATLHGGGSASATTNASGVAVITLPKYGAEYEVTVEKSRYRFTPVSPIVVTSNASQAIVGEALPIPVAPRLPICRVYGNLVNHDGTSSAGPIEFQVIGRDVTAYHRDSNAVAIARDTVNVTPKELGYWEFDVAHGALVRISIPSIKFTRLFTVPAEDMLAFDDIREAPGAIRENLTSDSARVRP